MTGSSGYLGGEVMKALRDTEATADMRVVVPIRNKGGETGPERFEQLFGGREGAVWADPAAALPETTEVVIMNAFDVAFHQDVQRVLRESVAPMLALAEECIALKKKLGKLKRVVVVSTAFVQPPLPYKRCDGPIVPFGGAVDPWPLYYSLLKGEKTMEDLRKDPANNPHNCLNAYIYSKTLCEHLLATYADLPIVIVRPSIIGPSSDGKRGSPRTPGCASIDIMLSPLGRFMPSTGIADNIFVDDVAKRVVDGVTMDLEPPGNHVMVLWATNGLPAGWITIAAIINPRKWIFQVPVAWRSASYRFEACLAWLIGGALATLPPSAAAARPSARI